MITAIKGALPLKAYLAEHGIEFTKGKTLCFAHDDKRPSLGIYRGRDNFERIYCFGCGFSGDIFDAAQAFHGINFKTALKLLAGRAGLKPANTQAERIAAEKARAERERKQALIVGFRLWERGAVNETAELLKALRRAILHASRKASLTEAELENRAVLQGAVVEQEYFYSILCSTDADAKKKLLEEMGYGYAES